MDWKRRSRRRNTRGGKPIVVRYADDFVILHSDKKELQKAAERVAKWLKHMGLQLHPSKTRVTHTLHPTDGNVGFDFLGFHVRQYPVGKTHTGKNPHGRPLGYKTLVRPSKQAIKHHTQKIKRQLRELRTAPQEKVIGALNPIIQGWCNYHRWIVCTEAFAACDHILFHQLVRWGNARHNGRGKRRKSRGYWIRIDTQTRFGMYVNDETGNRRPTYVIGHAQTQHQDWVKVRGPASPYDGNLLYWAKRLKQHPLVGNEKAKLLHRQQWQCPRCGLYFKEEDVLEIDHIVPKALGGRDAMNNKCIYHRHCHDEKTAEDMALITKRKAEGITHK